jgi:hypothetical protein
VRSDHSAFAAEGHALPWKADRSFHDALHAEAVGPGDGDGATVSACRVTTVRRGSGVGTWPEIGKSSGFCLHIVLSFRANCRKIGQNGCNAHGGSAQWAHGSGNRNGMILAHGGPRRTGTD